MSFIEKSGTLAKPSTETLLRLSVLLDVRLPNTSGLKVLEVLGRQGVLLPTILLTTFDDDKALLQGMCAGAKGFLLKDVSLERLVGTIRRVIGGENCFRPALTERALVGIKGIPREFDSFDPPWSFARREREVLALMAGGRNNLEIAVALGASEGGDKKPCFQYPVETGCPGSDTGSVKRDSGGDVLIKAS